MAEQVVCDHCGKAVSPYEYQRGGDWWHVEGVGELRTRMVNVGTPLGPWDFCSLQCLADGTNAINTHDINTEKKDAK